MRLMCFATGMRTGELRYNPISLDVTGFQQVKALMFIATDMIYINMQHMLIATVSSCVVNHLSQSPARYASVLVAQQRSEH